MWSRRIELGLFAPVLAVWKHTDPNWAGRIPQVAALADMERARAQESLAILDEALAQREFLAGDRLAWLTSSRCARSSSLLRRPTSGPTHSSSIWQAGTRSLLVDPALARDAYPLDTTKLAAAVAGLLDVA